MFPKLSRTDGKFTNAISALLGSTLILTLGFLCITDRFLAYTKPLKYLNATGFTPLDQNPLVSKLPDFLRSSDNPDILILGSSLTLVPAVRCDDHFAGRQSRYDKSYARNHINCYEKAEYFRSLLESRSGREMRLRNLGVVASVFSDHELILEKALKSGKKPKMVICCTAPRDFFSNHSTNIESSPVFQALAGLDNLTSLTTRGASLKELVSRATERLWHFYMIRADYRTVALAATSQFLHHPIDLYSAAKNSSANDCSASEKNQIEIGINDPGNIPDYHEPANILNDIEVYRNVYLPVNQPQFNTQANYLRKMLKLCQEGNIKLVVVNMPLTRENKAILPVAAMKQYKDLLQSETNRFGAVFYDADSNDYALNDFEDSCHMNKNGGKKFYVRLADELTKYGAGLASRVRQL